MSKKKIIFVTGTRADYGKLKSLIFELKKNKKFSVNVFITGIHNLKKYGFTFEEIVKDKVKNYFKYENQKLDAPFPSFYTAFFIRCMHARRNTCNSFSRTD